MGIADGILKLVLNKAEIVYKSRLSASVIHIRIRGGSIATASFIPGYFLRIAIGVDNNSLAFRDKVRSYTVWNMDRENWTIDLAVVIHGKGPGSEWAERCKVGDTVLYAWHKGNFILDESADSYLMIGDLSALAHLYEINRNLSKTKTANGIMYSSDKRDLFPDIDGSEPFSFYELPPNDEQTLIRLVKQAVNEMTGKKIVYIGGDSRVCIAVTRYFRKELGWENSQIKTKPFWNPLKKGLE